MYEATVLNILSTKDIYNKIFELVQTNNPLPELRELLFDLVIWLNNIAKGLHGIVQINDDNILFYWKQSLLPRNIKTLHDGVHNIREFILPETPIYIENKVFLKSINLKPIKVNGM